MKTRTLVPLAAGFEEIEAVAIIDTLRRAMFDVVTVSLDQNLAVTGAHGITVQADGLLSEAEVLDFDMMVLPGGMPGSKNLKESPEVISALQALHAEGKICAAICAAPMVLAHAGVIEGVKVTVFPDYKKDLAGAVYVGTPVVHDGTTVTAKGPGAAIPFALKLVEIVKGTEFSLQLAESMQVYWI